MKKTITKLTKFKLSSKKLLILIIIYYLLVSTLYAVASIVNHNQYNTLIDLAIFNQGIWQYSQFKIPFVQFHLNRPFLGDHFHPILIILAPLYWFYSNAKVLLIAQPFIMLSAIIPLFLIAKKQTKSIFFSLSIIFAFSFYLPLQRTIFYHFHAIVFTPPLFALAYYFFTQNRQRLTALFLILLLLVKEEMGLFVATFGIYLFLFKKAWRKFGIITTITGIAYTLIITHLIIPAIGGNYLYFDYGDSGNTPLEVVTNTIKNPVKMSRHLYYPNTKITTLHNTFWPFAYLPLFNPFGFLLSFEQFFSRFMDLRTINRWRNDFHYSAPMTIIVALSTIITAKIYSKFFSKNKHKLFYSFLGLIIFILTLFQQIHETAVFYIIKPQFWHRTPWMKSIDQALLLLPKNASVSTLNNILPHISNRPQVFFIKDYQKAQYVLLDFHPNQSIFNYIGVKFTSNDWLNLESKIKNLIKKGKYQTIYHQNQVYLLKKTL